jgi:hypothetical protein
MHHEDDRRMMAACIPLFALLILSVAAREMRFSHPESLKQQSSGDPLETPQAANPHAR